MFMAVFEEACLTMKVYERDALVKTPSESALRHRTASWAALEGSGCRVCCD
jgi:hypothetical protein